MSQNSDPDRSTGKLGRFPRVRRVHSSELRPTRSPLLNMVMLITLFAVVVFLGYQFLFERSPTVSAEVVDLSQAIEQIQELSTVKSHLRFAVLVREQDGNILVRQLADQNEYIGMDNLSSALFHDPTMIVQLHGVATYGIQLHTMLEGMQQDDSTVTLHLPNADVLDTKLVAADTKIVARIKGLFRSSNDALLQEANRHGDKFVLEFAQHDTELRQLATQRARELLALLVERAGKRTVFK